jgi:carboxylesterase type B
VVLNNANDSLVNYVIKVYGSPNSSTAYRGTIEQMIGDKGFKCPVERLAKEFYHRHLPVYYYEYGHRTSVNPWADWMGVMHGYEIDHVFGLPLAPSSKYTEQEKKFSRDLIKYWTNFAKSGNPNTDGKGGYAEKSWPAYTKKEDNVMYLSAKEITNNKFKTRQKYCQALSAITPYLYSSALPQFQLTSSLIILATSMFILVGFSNGLHPASF